MATDNIERLHYYQRQYLGALDFEAQQTYHRDMRRRLNLAHHTWGIVSGLELVVGANGVDINITPGMAIDGFGREIVMFMPTQLDPALFRSFHGVGYHTVCLEYTEALTQSPQAGYGQCDQPNQFGRVGENFQVVVEDPSRENITVNGQAILFPTDTTNPTNPTMFFKNITDPEDKPVLPPPPLPSPGPDNQILPLDESVPYQELPVDDPTVPSTARWLIPLGRVRWDGTTGKQQFAGDKNNPIKSEDGRHYIGSVASRLLTPARNLVVRDRGTNVPLPAFDPNKPPPVPDGVVMTIEGTLQVDRLLTAKDSIEMDGGALDFRDAGGSSDGKGGTDPLFTISRIDPGAAGGTDLRIQIGKDKDGKNRFVVGTTDTTNNPFWVADNGSAQFAGPLDVKTNLTIEGILDFGTVPREMIKLWASNTQRNTIGIVPDRGGATTSFRSSNAFSWVNDNDQLQLKLDQNGNLFFDAGASTARTRQMLNLWSTNYGIGVQPNTLYYRSDSDFCWFKSGSHSNIQSDPGGGTLQMKLDANGALEVFADQSGHIAFVSKFIIHNQPVSVKLGQYAGPHGADSVYGYPNLWLDTDGSVVVKKGLHIPSTSGAAYFSPKANYTPQNGDVVVLNSSGTVNPSTTPDDPTVVGVVSTDPGFILEDQPLKQGSVYVALMGIVQCNVDATTTTGNGPIDIGSLLTTSNTPGHAQNGGLAPLPGTVLGKALEKQTSGIGSISVLLMLS